MKHLLFISILCLGFLSPGCCQQELARQEICWVTPDGVDSSLNRYVYISHRTSENPRIITHLNAAGEVVDVSAGGTFHYGYCHCCTRDTLPIPRIEDFNVSAPTINPLNPTQCGSTMVAIVYGVSNTSQIEVELDGSPVSFDYDPQSKTVTSTQNTPIGSGIHTFTLTVTIPSGITVETGQFNCS